jgi:DNA-binding beta-propeller fold protein YncE
MQQIHRPGRNITGKIRSASKLFITAAVVFAVSTSLGARASEAEDQPLKLERAIKIPDVPLGPYSDTMALDLAGNRLFATPQAAKAVAVIDLAGGKVIKMLPGLGNPHAIVYNENVRRLFVVDGATGDLKVFSGDDYSLIKTISLSMGADMAAYDPSSQIFYVNNGGERAGMDHVQVSAVDTVKMEKIADIALPATDVEGSVVDPLNQKLYVNLSDTFSVAVVDLKSKKVVDVWKLPEGEHSPYAAAVDAENHRLYVACRDHYYTQYALHGSVVVLDTRTGRAIETLPIGGWADGIFIDKKRKRVHVSSGLGRVETFEILANGGFRAEPSVDTALLAKTSLFSPELDRLFVTVPQLGSVTAQVMVFKPLP